MAATEREVDKWRKQAETALARAARLMEALLFAAKELVRLTEMHQADDFAHCQTCKTPWPCPTALEVKAVSEVFERARAKDEGEPL